MTISALHSCPIRLGKQPCPWILFSRPSEYGLGREATEVRAWGPRPARLRGCWRLCPVGGAAEQEPEPEPGAGDPARAGGPGGTGSGGRRRQRRARGRLVAQPQRRARTVTGSANNSCGASFLFGQRGKGHCSQIGLFNNTCMHR